MGDFSVSSGGAFERRDRDGFKRHGEQEGFSPDDSLAPEPARLDQGELQEILGILGKGTPFELRHKETFYKAVEAGLIEHYDEDTLFQKVEGIDAEIAYCSDELRHLSERSSDRPGKPAAESLQALEKRAHEAMEQYAKLDQEYNALIRASEDPLKKLGRFIRSLFGRFSKPAAPEEQNKEIETANDRRIEALHASREAQQAVVEHQIRKQEEQVERERAGSRRDELTRSKAQAEGELKALSELRPGLFGYSKITPTGRLASVRLDAPGTDLTKPAEDLFERHLSYRSKVIQQADTADVYRSRLVDTYSYPLKGAELIAWYLVNRRSESGDILDSFHKSHQTVSRFVQPSYTQLLLSLQIQSADCPPFDALNKLSKMSRNLPNFERAERYIVAHSKERIEGDQEPQKQERLMKFVDLLTGPLGEQLSGFERYMIAARLGSFPGESVLIAERFGFTQRALTEMGIAPSYRSALAALTLMQSEARGEARMEPFKRAYQALRTQDEKLAEDWMLECAFLSVLPGDTLDFLDCMHIARHELNGRGYSPDYATVLALPAALPAVRLVWEKQVEREALGIAQRVNELDEQLSVREFNDRRENIRRARLEEEILVNISSLHKLYDGINGTDLSALWRSMAEAATAKSTIEIDEMRANLDKATEAARAHAAASGGHADKLDELLAAEEDLLREIREAELGRETN